MQLVILRMGAAEGTFDFDLELKKRSSLATILDKNSYTFDWIPWQCLASGRDSDSFNDLESLQTWIWGPGSCPCCVI